MFSAPESWNFSVPARYTSKILDMDVSFVIPCYRSTNALEDLVADLTRQAREAFEHFEIVLVRDSTDEETNFRLTKMKNNFPEVRLVRLSRNFGQQAATVAGIVHSQGKIVVTLDDDYQHRPSDALKMISVLQENSGVDLVYGRPMEPSDAPYRVKSGHFYRKVLRHSGLKYAESLSPFRAFRGSFRSAFSIIHGPNVSVDATLGWVVDSICTLECAFNSRQVGQSGYTRFSLIKVALSFLLVYTTKPLRAGVYLGIGGVIAATIYAGIILFNFVFGGITVPGFATTTLLVLFLGSLQLLLLGIIGVYLGHQHRRGLSEPAYFVVADDS